MTKLTHAGVTITTEDLAHELYDYLEMTDDVSWLQAAIHQALLNLTTDTYGTTPARCTGNYCSTGTAAAPDTDCD